MKPRKSSVMMPACFRAVLQDAGVAKPGQVTRRSRQALLGKIYPITVVFTLLLGGKVNLRRAGSATL
jgi:hypothetical protein